MRPRLYLLSAPADHDWLQRILTQFRPLQRSGQLDVFSIHDVQTGADLQQSHRENLRHTHYLLPLLSAPFLADDQLYQQLLEALQPQGKPSPRVLPVLLRECQWTSIPELSGLRPLPHSGQYLSNSEIWPHPDVAAAALVSELWTIIDPQPHPTHPSTPPRPGRHYTDPRDGEQYRVCEWAGQLWMGENLRFVNPTGHWPAPQAQPHCGAYYTWATAQRICPPGWRLPSDQDWRVLFDFFQREHLTYKHLLPGGDSQLNFFPAGKWVSREQQTQLRLAGQCGFYWTGEEANYGEAIYYMFDDGPQTIRRIAVSKQVGASVRLLWAD
ncbi:MAG: FISUMP domain-containing protein [Bacteroidota bacterium]